MYPNAHRLGCSTAGEILGTTVSRDTVAITALAFAKTAVAVARVDVPDLEESFEAGKRLIQSLEPRGLKHIFVLSEVLQVDASQVMNGINSALPGGVTVSRGLFRRWRPSAGQPYLVQRQSRAVLSRGTGFLRRSFESRRGSDRLVGAIRARPADHQVQG